MSDSDLVFPPRKQGKILSVPGPRGPQGVPGPQGSGLEIDKVVATYADLPSVLGPTDDGYSAFVNADARLYVWNGSAWPTSGAGADARGPQGLTGAQGTAGTPGDKGDKGDQGDRGLQGDAGIQGIAGDRGIQGLQGDTGATGVKGDTGLTGTTGAKGDKGDKGDGLQINAIVADYAHLPTTGLTAGYSVFVQSDGRLYIWSGTAWPASGSGAQIQGQKGDTGATGAAGTNGTNGASTWDAITGKPAVVVGTANGTPIPWVLWGGSEAQYAAITTKDPTTIYLRTS